VGFAGVLVVVQPGPETFNPVALYVLLGAAANAGSFLAVKELSRTEPTTVIVVFMVIYLVPLALVPALSCGAGRAGARCPTWSPWGVRHARHLAMTRGFAAAEMSVVLPFDYLRLPFAAAMAYLVFAEMPARSTFAWHRHHRRRLDLHRPTGKQTGALKAQQSSQ